LHLATRSAFDIIISIFLSLQNIDVLTKMAAIILVDVLQRITNKFPDLSGTIIRNGQQDYVEITSSSHTFSSGNKDDPTPISIDENLDRFYIMIRVNACFRFALWQFPFRTGNAIFRLWEELLENTYSSNHGEKWCVVYFSLSYIFDNMNIHIFIIRNVQRFILSQIYIDITIRGKFHFFTLTMIWKLMRWGIYFCE